MDMTLYKVQVHPLLALQCHDINIVVLTCLLIVSIQWHVAQSRILSIDASSQISGTLPPLPDHERESLFNHKLACYMYTY